MNKARPRAPSFTRVDKGTHQHNPNMQGKVFPCARLHARTSRGAQASMHGTFSGRPLKDLVNYHFSLWNIFLLLLDYWIFIMRIITFIVALDTMDKHKNQMGSAAAVTRGTG